MASDKAASSCRRRTSRDDASTAAPGFLIYFFYLAVTLSWIGGVSAGWQEDVLPKKSVMLSPEHVLRFHGNHSHPDHFKLLELQGNNLIVGARNIIYNLSLHELTENRAQRLEWHPASAHREMCLVKGKSEDDCQNYIRVLAHMKDGEMLVCGTNAFSPLCRRYGRNGTNGLDVVKEFSGKGFSPHDPNHNSTFVLTEGELYTGTASDFSGLDPLIYKEPFRTEQYDYKSLNAPNFVNSMADGDFVFFFFRETASEFINCGKTVYSRVARVCKNDRGATQNRFSHHWTTFLKARLNCSLPGEFPFYFDEIQSTSEIVEGTYGHRSERLIYGVFTTPENSIFGSAICAFRMQDILDSFNGPFREQATMNSNWLPVNAHEVPEPRPGQCVNDTRTLPEVTLNFIKSHNLMDEAVPAFYGQPLVTHTSFKYKFTKLAVDPQVRAADGKTYDILIIGTDKGKVIRAINSKAYDSANEVAPVVIEEIQVFSESQAAITNLRVVQGGHSEGPRLIVISNDEIQTISLRRCHSKSITTCSECVALQDPHCAWNAGTSRCVPVASVSPASAQSALIQSIPTGYSDQCPDNAIIKAKEKHLTTLPAAATVAATEDEPSMCEPCSCPCAPQESSSSASSLPSSTTTTQPTPTASISTTTTTPTSTLSSISSTGRLDVELETNVIVQEGDGRRHYVIGDSSATIDAEDNVINPAATGPKVSASVTASVGGIYSAETFTIAVVVSCFASLVVGFLAGLIFSRRCSQLGSGSGDSGFTGAPYLEQRRLSRMNESGVSCGEPSKMNNFVDSLNSVVKLAHEKNANAANQHINANNTLDLKVPAVQKVKKTYV